MVFKLTLVMWCTNGSPWLGRGASLGSSFPPLFLLPGPSPYKEAIHLVSSLQSIADALSRHQSPSWALAICSALCLRMQ